MGANMGPIWGRQDPSGPHVGAMNFVIWVITENLDQSKGENLDTSSWFTPDEYVHMILDK